MKKIYRIIPRHHVGASTLALALLILVAPSVSGALIDENNDRLELYKSGIQKFEEKKLEKAFVDFENFIKKYPADFDVRNAVFYMAEIRRQQKKYFDAIRYYGKLLDRYPNSKWRGRAVYRQAVCYARVGLRSRAKVQYREYLKKFPKGRFRLMVYYQMGELYFESRNYDKSLSYFNNALILLENIKKPDEKINKLLRKVRFRMGVMYARDYRNVPRAYELLTTLRDDPGFDKKKKDSIRFILKDISFFHLSAGNGLPENTISAISFDGDDVYIGTWLKGILRFTRSTGGFKRITPKDGLVSGAVRDIFVDFHEIWVATYDGVSLYRKKDESFQDVPYKDGVKPPRMLQTIFKDNRYVYFASLTGGVTRYDRVKFKFENFAGKKDGVGSVQKITGNKKFLAFATLNGGVALYNKKAEKFIHLDKENGLPGNTITDVLFQGKYLWIAVHGYGLKRYDWQKEEWADHPSANGENQPHPYPTTLRQRGLELWVGTLGAGVRILNLQTGKWERLSVIEGLSSNEVKLIEFEEDYVWIGSLDRGITIVYRPKPDAP